MVSVAIERRRNTDSASEKLPCRQRAARDSRHARQRPAPVPRQRGTVRLPRRPCRFPAGPCRGWTSHRHNSRQGQRSAIGGLRLWKIAQPLMTISQVIECVGRFRPQLHRRLIGGDRAGIIPLRLQGHSQVKVCLGEARIGLRRTPIGGRRFFPLMQRCQHFAQTEVVSRLIGKCLGGLPDRQSRGFGTASLQFQQAALKQGRRVSGGVRQNLLIRASRFVQIARPMLIRRQLQKLVDGHTSQQPRLAVLAFN